MTIQSEEALLWGRLLSRHEIEMQFNGKVLEDLPCFSDLVRLPMIEETEKGWCCGRCHNQNPKQFLEQPESSSCQQGLVYCLNCLTMGRMCQGEELYYLPSQHQQITAKYESYLTWFGQLSAEQQRASQELCQSLTDPDHPHLVHAVTGAGKTEMIFPVINQVLIHSGRVCLASPRIDVCLELYPRLQAAFNQVHIGLFYGESEPVQQYCPLIIATSHQLLRFKAAFDLLIMDEVDAFPYADDLSLHFAARRAVMPNTGKLIYLTATPDDRLRLQLSQGELKQTCLPARFHGHPLPEPQFVWLGNWRQQIINQADKGKLFKHLQQFIQGEGIRLIFMPSIPLAEALFNWLESLPDFQGLACVHARDPQRKDKVNQLRQGQLKGLISTTILERGVTFTNCHVSIIGAEDKKYSRAALVQMSGRVGRRPDFPAGQLYYAHYGISKTMIEAQQEIRAMNRQARERGLLHD